MVFSTVFVHRETSGHLIRRGQHQGIVLIKNVEKVKRRVARRSKVPKDHPCRVGWCNCTNYARTTVLFIRRGLRKRGPCLKPPLRLIVTGGGKNSLKWHFWTIKNYFFSVKIWENAFQSIVQKRTVAIFDSSSRKKVNFFDFRFLRLLRLKHARDAC